MNIAIAIAIGFLSGYFSGQFGVGGGLITTPAIRIILQRSAFIALGTPLLVIIPAAATGTVNYAKQRLINWKLGIKLFVFGIAGTLLGAYATKFLNGDILMFITSFVILFIALRFLGFSLFENLTWKPKNKFSYFISIAILGLVTGFYSGFLGLGGSVLIIPGLILIFKMPIKQAFGTSLFTVALIAIPSTFAHYFLSHVDLQLGLLLILGSIPGAYFGSKVTIKMKERTLNIAFGIFLLLVALYFGGFEILKLL